MTNERWALIKILLTMKQQAVQRIINDQKRSEEISELIRDIENLKD